METNEKFEKVITITHPTKEARALLSWLKANMSDDGSRPHMQFIWFDDKSNWWAFSGYAIVRGSMWDDKGKFVDPGLYRILTNSKDLIELGVLHEEQCYRTSNLVDLWDRVIDLQTSVTCTLNPKYLVPIIKPFEQVTVHVQKNNDAVHIMLNEGKDLPFGRYGAILMPINIDRTNNNNYHDGFKMAGFTVRYPMPRRFKYHHDAGHGWLEVDLEALMALGLVDKISEHSYMNGSKVYLEEYDDMGKFISRVKTSYGFTPEYQDVTTDTSPIRDYPYYQYKVDQVQTIIQ